MKKSILIILSALLFSTIQAQDLFVEAESFNEKGGWVVDQQSMDIMGSPYLMAHGLGEPVADASTSVEFDEPGTYYVFVRTNNWTHHWHNGDGPGKFKLKVNNKVLPTLLGHKQGGWHWQTAGKVKVKKGANSLSLIDQTGFNGRCDAIYFSKTNTPPPHEVSELELFRKEKLSINEKTTVSKEYDFVVVGGGIAGISAAAAASRLGLKTALINDRPVLGGNNSSEIRVHLGGFIEQKPYEGLGRIIREFGHTKLGNAQPAENYEDQKKEDFVLGEENIDLYANTRAISVIMDGNKIKGVIVKNILTSEETILEAPIFSDCTGDGTIGALAGADFRMGRESKFEFGESLAPDVADKMTMGSSVQWYSTKENKSQRFPIFKYGIEFNEDNSEKVTMGEWKWEVGMRMDQITEIEKIRDYALLVIFSNWSFLKNEHKDKAKYRNHRLDWVAQLAGKRESRRLMGDYILKQDDIHKNVFHEDASFTTTWSIDLHFPDPDNSAHFPEEEFKAKTNHLFIYPYAVPYRCLYSRNIDNLFMAGRNISQTHVALGTTRVMRTTGMMGEVVGIAASICNKNDATPREVYQNHLDELKEIMKVGLGKTDAPDNQNFNTGTQLKEPIKQ